MTTLKEYLSLSKEERFKLIKLLPSSGEVNTVGMVLTRTELKISLQSEPLISEESRPPISPKVSQKLKKEEVKQEVNFSMPFRQY